MPTTFSRCKTAMINATPPVIITTKLGGAISNGSSFFIFYFWHFQNCFNSASFPIKVALILAGKINRIIRLQIRAKSKKMIRANLIDIYNLETACKAFLFGGCKGNANNFLTLQDCNDKCNTASNNDNKLLDNQQRCSLERKEVS